MERTPGMRHEGDESSRTARLLHAYHAGGDITARDELIGVYLPLVRSFARRYARGSGDYDDLYQVGCIGLINAIDRFRPDRGEELAAFAVPNIAGEMRRYLRDRGPSVRLPRRVLELRGLALRAQGDLAARLGRAPAPAEVAAELGADERDVALALDAERLSRASELGGEEPGGEPLDAVEDRVFLSEAFRGLGEAERRVLYLRYVRDLEPADIARELGLSTRQLSRRTQAALEKLRRELERTSARGSEEQPERRLPSPARKPKMSSMATARAVEEDFLTQPYHIELVREPAGGWTARVEELAGCVARGATHDEAVVRAEEAMAEWIAEARAEGREVPRPRPEGTHSGRLLVRMPQSLHAELARAAERDEVSLNQFITSALASVIGWRRGTVPGAGRARGPEAAPRRVLTLNLVVLCLVGAIALALLAIELAQKL